jgi:hypothetical protein
VKLFLRRTWRLALLMVYLFCAYVPLSNDPAAYAIWAAPALIAWAGYVARRVLEEHRNGKRLE